MPRYDDPISGYFLESNEWVKTANATYERGARKVTYDGTYWYYDGRQIEDSISKNKYLKKPSFNYSPPFKDDSDYYSRMMENK